jgi:tetratricopeptide (TPR) repeat protein
VTPFDIERLRKAGDLDGALQLIQKSSKILGGLDPWLAHQYAMVLIAKRQWADALAALMLLAAKRPANAQVRYQIATCLEQLGQYIDAKDAFKQATMLHAKDASQPDAARSWFGLGSCLYRLGKDDEARGAWERGLSLPVDTADGRFQRGLVHLALGNFREGWADYEARKELHGYREGLTARGVPDELPPAWDGQSRGRVLCIGTQGAGDVIQFSRYLPFVAERSGCEPRLMAGPELGPWLGYQREGECVWSVALDSLPLVLGMPEPIPPTLHWRYPQANTKPVVGVCWKGNPHHGNDRDRSSPISFLEAFTDERWSVVSLQQGEGAHFPNYRATADAISHLDAVVSVDTSVIHVAGTLGVPSVVIPQCCPDYRWGIKGDRTPWYPSVRVVRRKKHDDWPNAIGRAKKQLREML